MKRTGWLVGILVLVSGCSGADRGGASQPAATLTVFAASSLQESFARIATDFETRHPDARVTLTFGPSSGLARQLVEGASADVFAAASPPTMATVVSAGLADGAPIVLARNSLAIAVPAGNPAHVKALVDLGRAGVKVAICQPAVPCGALAKTVLEKARVTVSPVSQDLDVKAVLTKVTLGEVDAGLVYVTDTRAASTTVDSVAIPDAVNATTDYQVAALKHGSTSPLARDFVSLLTSASARKILSDAGFGLP